jgi:hypothetical protein
MNSKYFIWIFHTSTHLCEFFWIFCDFRSIFRAFKQFLDLSGIVFALKINSKKNILFYLGRPRRPDPAYPGPASARETLPSLSLSRLHAGPARHPYRCAAPDSGSYRAGRAAAPAPPRPAPGLARMPMRDSLGLFKGRRRSLPPFPKP